MKDELQRRVNGQMNPIGLELGSGKAWQNMEIGWAIGVNGLGEQS